MKYLSLFAHSQVDASDGILIVGTTLEVYSVFRLARAAFRAGVPIAILNQGETRVEREALSILASNNRISSSSSDAADEDSSALTGGSGGSDDADTSAINRIIQFKSETDCGQLLSALCSHYRNI